MRVRLRVGAAELAGTVQGGNSAVKNVCEVCRGGGIFALLAAGVAVGDVGCVFPYPIRREGGV
jgi:hypothetical protein